MTPEEAGDRCAPRYWQRGKGGNGRPIEAQTSRNWTSHTPTLTKTEEHPLLSQGIHPLQGDFFSCHRRHLATWPSAFWRDGPCQFVSRLDDNGPPLRR